MTDNRTMEEVVLKNCPFCGNQAGILNNNSNGKDDSDYPTGTIIGCFHCKIKTPWFDGYYEADGTGLNKAIELWNARKET